MSSPRAAATKAVHKAAHKTAHKEAAHKQTAHKTAPTPPLKPARKTTAKAVPRPAVPRPAVARPAGAPADASAQAIGLAAAIEASLADGNVHALTPQALQALLGAVCRAYAAQVEAGHPLAALAQRTSVSPTEVMVTASGLLRAANLAVFELGMWQSWTGR